MSRRGIVGLAVALSIAVVGGVAVAHTHVAETNPTDNAVAEKAPEQVYIRFGEEGFPATPGQISDGRLEVYDACGTQVNKDDSTANMQDGSITVSSTGAVSGRYEAHWFATASDGAEQSGVFDFDVEEGTPCVRAARTDPAGDVDLGFDVVSLRSKRTTVGARLTLGLAAPIGCADLTDKDLRLEVNFDSSSDRVEDATGVLRCTAGTLGLVFEDGQKLRVTQPSPKMLSVGIRKHAALQNLDVFVESTADKDECEEKVCAEVAPDLGLLSVF